MRLDLKSALRLRKRVGFDSTKCFWHNKTLLQMQSDTRAHLIN